MAVADLPVHFFSEASLSQITGKATVLFFVHGRQETGQFIAHCGTQSARQMENIYTSHCNHEAQRLVSEFVQLRPFS